MNIQTISDFRRAMRHGPYAWPGGYPCYFITHEGEALSFAAARRNRRLILASIAGAANDGWRVIGMDINWEDGEIICCDSGEHIESAYAEERSE